MWDSKPWICTVGLLEMTSLSRLYSMMERVRFGEFIGGRMNLSYFDCVKLRHEL